MAVDHYERLKVLYADTVYVADDSETSLIEKILLNLNNYVKVPSRILYGKLNDLCQQYPTAGPISVLAFTLSVVPLVVLSSIACIISIWSIIVTFCVLSISLFGWLVSSLSLISWSLAASSILFYSYWTISSLLSSSRLNLSWLIQSSSVFTSRLSQMKMTTYKTTSESSIKLTSSQQLAQEYISGQNQKSQESNDAQQSKDYDENEMKPVLKKNKMMDSAVDLNELTVNEQQST